VDGIYRKKGGGIGLSGTRIGQSKQRLGERICRPVGQCERYLQGQCAGSTCFRLTWSPSALAVKRACSVPDKAFCFF
jgi:hypothetical protein